MSGDETHHPPQPNSDRRWVKLEDEKWHRIELAPHNEGWFIDGVLYVPKIEVSA